MRATFLPMNTAIISDRVGADAFCCRTRSARAACTRKCCTKGGGRESHWNLWVHACVPACFANERHNEFVLVQ